MADTRNIFYGLRDIKIKKLIEDEKSVASENIGTGDGVATTFNFTLIYAPVSTSGLSITDGTETFTVSAIGGDGYTATLTGDVGGTGSLNILTGAGSITFAAAPGSGVNITADYTGTEYDANYLDIYGVSEFKPSPKYTEKEIKGDDTTLDTMLSFDQWDLDIKCYGDQNDILSILIGASISTDEKEILQKGTDKPSYFKLEGQVYDNENGDKHYTFFKCKTTDYTPDHKVDDYATYDIKVKAISLGTNDFVMYIKKNDTATAIS